MGDKLAGDVSPPDQGFTGEFVSWSSVDLHGRAVLLVAEGWRFGQLQLGICRCSYSDTLEVCFGVLGGSHYCRTIRYLAVFLAASIVYAPFLLLAAWAQ